MSQLVIVGITSYRECSRWGVWDVPADVLPADYARSVEAAGAAVMLLPPGEPAAATEVLGRLDALVVAGGADIEPGRYGAAVHPSSLGWRPDRDSWELALLAAAAVRDIPTLMICRGMQLEAVRRGGSLDQHIPDLTGSNRHSPGGDRYGAIDVATVAGSRLARIVGSSLTVRCHHHQSVNTHPGLRAVAHASDGIIEAVEDPGRSFCFGVQWHPEVQPDAGLFSALIRAAS